MIEWQKIKSNERKEKLETNSEEEIINGVKVKKAFLLNQYDEQFHDLIVDYARNIRNKYPDDYKEYILYQILISSTPGEEGCPKFDFPGEDSVLVFLDKASAGLEKAKTTASKE